MANVLQGNNCCVAKQTVAFATIGLDASNIAIIYDVSGTVTKSFRPERPVNAVTGFVINKGYYIVAKTNLSLEQYLAAPLPEGGEALMYDTITVNGDFPQTFPAGTVLDSILIEPPHVGDIVINIGSAIGQSDVDSIPFDTADPQPYVVNHNFYQDNTWYFSGIPSGTTSVTFFYLKKWPNV